MTILKGSPRMLQCLLITKFGGAEDGAFTEA